MTRGSNKDDAGPDLGGVLFVLGKGGVGKSVISAGLAALAARRGRPTLLVRIGESLEEVETWERTVVSGKDGVDEVKLDARVAMDEYVQHVIRLRPLVERITNSEVYRKFFAAAPGLPELVLLGRIRAYSTETDRQGKPRYQTIIVDCPSSGHGLLMLETPFAAFRAVPVGPFARLASQIIDWLKSAARVALVAIPEEMAVVEAIEFKDDLEERTGLKTSMAFMNRMRLSNLSKAARAALVEVDAPEGSNDRRLLDCAREVQRRSRLESFHERRLARGLNLQPVIVRDLPNCRPKTVASALAPEAA